MTGIEFMEEIAPANVGIQKAKFLYGNQAVYDGEYLHVTPVVYDCLADADTATETLLSLSIVCIPRNE